MDEYDPHISIGELTKARDCNYITKEVCIENTLGKVETPFKVFDVTKFDLKYFEDYINTSTEVLESIKYINQCRNYNSLTIF